jgi:hypothetical protein
MAMRWASSDDGVSSPSAMFPTDINSLQQSWQCRFSSDVNSFRDQLELAISSSPKLTGLLSF